MCLKNIPELVKDFLRLDSYKPEDIFYYKLLFPPLEKNSEVQNIAKRALIEQVMPYYAKREMEAKTGVYNFLVEPLKNANFHGPRNCNIDFELIMTPLVLAASFCDGGDYFKRREVKKAWENRVKFPERHDAKVDGIGYDAGTDLIYSLADLIHVDKSKGALYIGWMAKKFC